jgi:hypothetical protein
MKGKESLDTTTRYFYVITNMSVTHKHLTQFVDQSIPKEATNSRQLALSLATQIMYINIIKLIELGHTKNCIAGVRGHLVLCCNSNQSFRIRESYITGRFPVSLVIGNDFHLSMLEHTHTTVGCAQVNSNSWCFRYFQNGKTSDYM